MLKILKARLQKYMNCEFPDVEAGFRKGRGMREQITYIYWMIRKARTFRKTSTSALLTMPKPLTMWIKTNYGKYVKDGTTRQPYLPPEKPLCKSSSSS